MSHEGSGSAGAVRNLGQFGELAQRLLDVVDEVLGLSAGAVGLALVLGRLVAGDLAGLFDGPSTVRFDPTLPMVSLDLSRVTENAMLISVLMTCASAWMESALLDPAGGQRWVVYDEAWRLMSHPALLRRMDAHWRLARHYGIAGVVGQEIRRVALPAGSHRGWRPRCSQR